MRIKSYWLFSLLVVLALAMSCSRGRTDAQVTTSVQNEIGKDSAVPANSVAVQSSNGVVTLSGTVASEQVRIAAANDAARIEGVKNVVNNLQVASASATAPAPAIAPPPPSQSLPVAPAKVSAAKTRSGSKRNVGQGSSNSQKMSDADIYKDLSASAATPTDAGAPAPTPEPAPAPADVAPPPPPSKVTIPTGTRLSIRLVDGLDSEKNQVGDTFHATLNAPIVIDDQTVLPRNADLQGRVVDVKSAGKFAGGSVLTLELTSLSVNGKSYNIHTDEWTKNGTGQGKKTAAKAGGGAMLGAIIGGIAGGGRGAAIGTIAGGGAGAGAAAATNKANQIKLEPEALISFALQNSLTVTPQAANDRDSGRTQMNQ